MWWSSLGPYLALNLSQLPDPELFESKGRQGSLREDTSVLSHARTTNLSSNLLQKDYLFTKVAVQWGQGKIQSFWGFFNTSSERRLVSVAPECHGCLLVLLGI